MTVKGFKEENWRHYTATDGTCTMSRAYFRLSSILYNWAKIIIKKTGGFVTVVFLRYRVSQLVADA